MREFNYEKIDQYLDGQLQGPDLAAFEKELEADPELAAETQLLQEMQVLLRQSVQDQPAETALRQTLRSKGDMYFATPAVSTTPQAKAVRLTRRFWYRVSAAAAACLILFFVLLPSINGALSDEDVLAKYGNPEPLAITRGNIPDTFLARAISYYNAEKYQEALPLIDSSIAIDPANTSLLFAKGISLFKTGDYPGATTVFEAIGSGQTSFKGDAIRWQALLLVKTNQRKEAIVLLKALLRDNPDDKGTKKLLEDID